MSGPDQRTDDDTADSARTGGSGRPDDLAGTLLLRCRTDEVHAVAPFLDGRPRCGLVLTGTDAPKIAHSLRKRGFEKPLLCDAQRYGGNGHRCATAPFDEQWILSQRGLRAPVLTDSGRVGEDDLVGLRSILTRARALGEDVIACLPLHSSWLSDPTSLSILEEELHASGVPVALVPEHAGDPLDVPGTLRGLLRLLSGETPMLLLRGDVSALGALCFGAAAATVQTIFRLRRPRPVLAGHCLSHLGVDEAATAVRVTPDQVERWVCECDACGGRMMDRFATIGDPHEQESAALRHSPEVLLDLHENLRAPHLTPRQRRNSWVEQCSSARFYHQDIGTSMRPEWRIPPFLENWRRVGAEFVPHGDGSRTPPP